MDAGGDADEIPVVLFVDPDAARIQRSPRR
jgi:cytochrome c oxidase assembly protein Cox11